MAQTARWMRIAKGSALPSALAAAQPAAADPILLWLREAGECAFALIEGAFPAPLAEEPGLEAAFRERIEAQHGWQFDTAWPTGPEARTW